MQKGVIHEMNRYIKLNKNCEIRETNGFIAKNKKGQFSIKFYDNEQGSKAKDMWDKLNEPIRR